MNGTCCGSNRFFLRLWDFCKNGLVWFKESIFSIWRVEEKKEQAGTREQERKEAFSSSGGSREKESKLVPEFEHKSWYQPTIFLLVYN